MGLLRELVRPTPFKRALFYFLGDLLLSLFTFYLAYLLRFNFHPDPKFLKSFWLNFWLLFSLKTLALGFFNLYQVQWRFFSTPDLKKLLIAHLLAYTSFVPLYYLFKPILSPFPRSVLLIDLFLSIVALGGFRISKRLLWEEFNKSGEPVIVVGDGERVMGVLKGGFNFQILGIYSDNPDAIGSYLGGFKILPIEEIEGKGVKVVIAKEYPKQELQRLIEKLSSRGVGEILRYSPFEGEVKPLEIEKLLARKPKDLDREAIGRFIAGKRVLVTGAGGSIGSELVRQVLKYNAGRVVMVESSEYNLYRIGEEVEELGYRDRVRSCLVSVTDRAGLEQIFREERPEIVLHAAAYKHVPLCEANPRSAVQNNVLGTKIAIDLSIKYQVQKFVLISTDKAVRPVNIMGGSKRVCEIYAQNVPSWKTEIVAVRFGNVLGSSGSVIPKFQRLIKEGKPLPVTHPEVTRYFMLIDEAVQLVLQAASIAKGGEIFILDMGKPVKIVELARRMLQLHGLPTDRIQFVGLRPGEKLYEELLLDERDKETKYRDIFIAKSKKVDFYKLDQQIEELLTLKERGEIIDKFKEIGVEWGEDSLKNHPKRE
jgi:UDP-N-acetyl-D-glucosamine 4,6-dehydratase